MAGASQWLSRRGVKFGCSICCAAMEHTKNKRDKFATYSVTVLRKCNVLRHQNSALHQQSCALATGGCKPDKKTPRAE